MKLDLSKIVSVLQQQTCAQILDLQDAQHGFFESRREQVRPQEELYMKENVLQDTQIRNIHEMEKLREGKNFEQMKSQCKRENHETIQQLTSQLQQNERSNEFYE